MIDTSTLGVISPPHESSEASPDAIFSPKPSGYATPSDIVYPGECYIHFNSGKVIPVIIMITFPQKSIYKNATLVIKLSIHAVAKHNYVC